MTIGRIDINEKDLPKICGAVIQLEEHNDDIEDRVGVLEAVPGVSVGTGIGGSPGGRLTLQTLTPVMATTQSAKTTIYYTPYSGSTVPIYGGTNFTATSFSELSVATTDTTKSPAAIGASKVNDWFVWSDSGTLRLGHGPDWTSDTARSAGTALVMVNGILLNSVSITNGPAASRGTYIGTTRSNGSSQLDWIYGGLAVSGTAGFFGLWNVYNRRRFASFTGDTSSTWTYASGTWRNARASATMRCTFVRGLDEDVADAVYTIQTENSASGGAAAGVGVDSSTVPTGAFGYGSPTLSVGGVVAASYRGTPGLGVHFLQAIEASTDASTITYYSHPTSYVQMGIHITVEA